MIDLDINIKTNKDYINQLNDKIDLCKENYDGMVINLRKVDSAWNDLNTPVFLKHVNDDYVNFIELIESIKKNINNENNFLNSICNDCKRRFGFSQVSKVKFNSDGIYRSASDINNIINKLNNAISSFGNIVVPANFSSKNTIDQISFNLTTINNNLINLQNNLNGLINDFINNKNNAILEYNRIPLKTINNKKCEYNWQVVNNNNLKKIDLDFKESIYTINNNSNRQQFTNISSEIQSDTRGYSVKNDNNINVLNVIGTNSNNNQNIANIVNDISMNNINKVENIENHFQSTFSYAPNNSFVNAIRKNIDNNQSINMTNNYPKDTQTPQKITSATFGMNSSNYKETNINPDNNVFSNNSNINLSQLNDINIKTYSTNDNFKNINMNNINTEIKINNSNLQNTNSNINIENISQ